MSLYAEYCLEREGKIVLEDDKGFVSYVTSNDTIYIVDIFVRPEHRKSGHAARLADSVIEKEKGKGFKYLLGSVDPRLESATNSMKVLLAYGMSVQSIEPPLIYFIKEI